MRPRKDWREWWAFGRCCDRGRCPDIRQKVSGGPGAPCYFGASPRESANPRYTMVGTIRCTGARQYPLSETESEDRVFIFMSSFVGFIRLEQGRLDLGSSCL